MRRYIHLSFICALTIISSVIQAQDANGILYVKKGGAGTLSGNNWANAIAELGTALQNARTLNGATPGTVKEIWVAAGTYVPTTKIGGSSSVDNFKSFILVPDVKLYGHFAGTESSIAARDLTSSNATVLSGNLGSYNYVYHVLFGNRSLGSDPLVVDGFTVQEGSSSGTTLVVDQGDNVSSVHGGGIYLLNGASVKFNNMVVVNNYASSYGGGVAAMFSSNVSFQNSYIASNASGQFGGGIGVYGNDTVTLTNSTIQQCASSYGGGVYLNQGSPLIITNSLIQNNTAYSYGGGVFSQTGSPVTANGVQIKGNSGGNSGGGIYVQYSTGTNVFNNVLISGNYAGSNGAGIFIANDVGQLTNTTIVGNSSVSGGAIYNSSAGLTINNSVIYNNRSGIANIGSATIKYSLVQGVAADANAHNLSGNDDPSFTLPVDYNNGANADGNYTLQSGSILKNAGSNALYPGLSASSTDLAGSARVSNYANGGTIDIGAYELQQTAQSISVSNISKTYGVADFAPGFSATSGLTVSYTSADNSIAEAYQDASDGNRWKVTIKKAGTVQITASQAGNANYADASAAFTLTIAKATLIIKAKDSTRFYDGSVFYGGNGVTYTGFVNNEDSTTALTGTLTYGGVSQGAVNAGVYSITPGGLVADNYNINYLQGPLTIKKAPLTITARDSTKVYNGTAFSGGNGLKYLGFVNNEDSAQALTGAVTYSGTSQGAKNAGTYVIIPGGLTAANYTITYVSGTLTTGMAALTITAKDWAKVYNGAAFNGGNGLSYSGFVNNEDSTAALTGVVTYSGTSQGAVHTGNYAITPGGLLATNYTITYVSGRLTINKATLSIAADAQTKVVGSADPALTYTAAGFAVGDNISLITGALTRDAGEGAGVYAITQGTLLANADYTITYSGNNLTITKATNTITFTTQTAGATISKVYGSAGFDASATATSGLTVTYSSNNTAVATITGSGQVQIVGAGTASITASQAGSANYNAATDVSLMLEVTPASLTITANGFSKTYNAQAYSGGNGIDFSGFVNNETAAVLKGTLSYSGTSQGAKAAGSYVITPGGYTSANYSITYVNGTLTIAPAVLIIQANAQTKVYGTSDPALNFLATGFVGSDNTSMLTGTLNRDAGENAGDYAIRQNTLSAGGNYIISFTGNTFTITKASQNITWVQNLTTGCNGEAAITLTATSNSGLATTYSVDNTAIATVSGSVLTPVSPGSTVVTATQAGDVNHFAATAVTNTFNYILPSMVRQHWSDVLFFDNTGGTYVQWQWYKNNTAVAGANKAYYSESAALNGIYYAIVTDRNGKQVQTCPLTLTGSNTVAGGIKAYPNPASPAGIVTITCNYTITELQGARLILSTVGGTTLQQLTSVQTSNRLTMPVQSGIYIVTLLLDNGKKATVNLLVK
ncbi:right-handed parallel beta-helix repeat-containing protein [Pseudoflavitalea sp. G-6-1-2]|uniref:beta strand repeat-containing protein n=1 Tax=Pseudoflavitalea sp. G-6-1-2 TaxID=2728841 RepID=UPI00146B96EC|nr:MBG domain-containing protein [Pseudoflavitalea sp. G-6-1-2]NML21995.1 right-handed parallel beta-helix repeat-containing protein [Pseudoflavitalea sp. G-6-1-2]